MHLFNQYCSNFTSSSSLFFLGGGIGGGTTKDICIIQCRSLYPITLFKNIIESITDFSPFPPIAPLYLVPAPPQDFTALLSVNVGNAYMPINSSVNLFPPTPYPLLSDSSACSMLHASRFIFYNSFFFLSVHTFIMYFKFMDTFFL